MFFSKVFFKKFSTRGGHGGHGGHPGIVRWFSSCGASCSRKPGRHGDGRPDAAPTRHALHPKPHRTADACAEAPHATARSLAAPPHTLAPPACAHRCAQSGGGALRAAAGCVRDHREDRAAGVAATPLERVVDGPTARTHATVPACHLGCLGMCGVDQFVPSAGREGVGGRVAGVRDPEARDSVGSGPRAFPASSHACSRPRGDRGPAAAPHCHHELSARPAALAQEDVFTLSRGADAASRSASMPQAMP